MTPSPTLSQQIDAVVWAARHIDSAKDVVDTHGMRESEKDRFVLALLAAVETLKTLAFAREALR